MFENFLISGGRREFLWRSCSANFRSLLRENFFSYEKNLLCPFEEVNAGYSYIKILNWLSEVYILVWRICHSTRGHIQLQTEREFLAASLQPQNMFLTHSVSTEDRSVFLAPWKKTDEQACVSLESAVWKGRQEPSFMFLIAPFISFDDVYALIDHDNYSYF